MVSFRKRDIKKAEPQAASEPVIAPPITIDTTAMQAEIAALRQEIAAMRAKPAPKFEFAVRRDTTGRIESVTATPATLH